MAPRSCGGPLRVDRAAAPSATQPTPARCRPRLELRQHHRHRVHLAVRYARAHEFARAYAEDLSRGGLFIAGAYDLEPLEEVQVDIELPGFGTFSISAEAAHIIRPDRAFQLHCTPGTGMAITEAPDGFHAALTAYLQRLERRAKFVVFVSDEMLRALLANAGYQARPAPDPADLGDVLAQTEAPVCGIVVAREDVEEYRAAAEVADAHDVVIAVESADDADEADEILALLDLEL
jgi:hypothetical protein